jgi:hypothetical protein
MAVLLRFPHRSTANPPPERRDGREAPTAAIVILPCIRREAMAPPSGVDTDAPVLLKA